jgi:hypothetical protein
MNFIDSNLMVWHISYIDDMLLRVLGIFWSGFERGPLHLLGRSMV